MNYRYVFAAALSAVALSHPASAQITVDGTVDAAYGAPTATVATDPAAPQSNFGSPGNTATAGYDIYLTDSNDTLFGAVSQTGGSSAGAFSNLYFDLNPDTSSGSDFGIEVTNERGFIPGHPEYGYFDLADRIAYAVLNDNGLSTVEFSIANSVFRDAIANIFGSNYTDQDVRLNLSQSLSYSVAGGTSYGDTRLGRFSVSAVAGVPEPSTWAMMLFGFGMVGLGLRRRTRNALPAIA